MRNSELKKLIEEINKAIPKKKQSKELQDAIEKAEYSIKNYYPITSVAKEDIEQACLNHDDKVPSDVKKRIDELDEGEMEWLAEKLCDDYMEQLFWSSLRIIFEERLLKKEK